MGIVSSMKRLWNLTWSKMLCHSIYKIEKFPDLAMQLAESNGTKTKSINSNDPNLLTMNKHQQTNNDDEKSC